MAISSKAAVSVDGAGNCAVVDNAAVHTAVSNSGDTRADVSIMFYSLDLDWDLDWDRDWRLGLGKR